MIDAEMDVCPSFGWQGGPEFNTLIKQLRSGRERRRPLQDVVKHRYSLPFLNITNNEYLKKLKSVFLVTRGSAYSFLVKDFSDFEAVDAVFGAGDGVKTEFDLYVVSLFGSSSYSRLIQYPVNPTFYVDGVAAAATFNTDSKKVVFDAAPAENAVLSWTGEWRVLVRFVSDTFPMSIDNRTGQSYAMNGSIELLEVWE